MPYYVVETPEDVRRKLFRFVGRQIPIISKSFCATVSAMRKGYGKWGPGVGDLNPDLLLADQYHDETKLGKGDWPPYFPPRPPLTIRAGLGRRRRSSITILPLATRDTEEGFQRSGSIFSIAQSRRVAFLLNKGRRKKAGLRSA